MFTEVKEDVLALMESVSEVSKNLFDLTVEVREGGREEASVRLEQHLDLGRLLIINSRRSMGRTITHLHTYIEV